MHDNAIRLLKEANDELLAQGMELLEGVPDALYQAVPEGFAPHRASGHLRHVLEFYECLLGRREGVIDYDARRRDPLIERSRHAASARMRALRIGLRQIACDAAVQVIVEDAPDRNCRLSSTIGRELQVLASHTIHHYALIGLTLRIQGVKVPREFGMAPSTLRYERAAA